MDEPATLVQRERELVRLIGSISFTRKNRKIISDLLLPEEDDNSVIYSVALFNHHYLQSEQFLN